MQHEIASEPCRMGRYLKKFSINSMMALIKTNSLTRNEILIQLKLFWLFVPSTQSALKLFDFMCSTAMSAATFVNLIINIDKQFKIKINI